MAPRPDGGLFVAVPSDDDTVLASLDATGQVRAGWPILLAGSSDCRIHADPVDGSVRAACNAGDANVRSFAFDAAGRPLAGWPVDLAGGPLRSWMGDPTRLVDSALYVVFMSLPPRRASPTLVRVSRDGSVRTGVSVRDPDLHAYDAAIGPDGTAYVVAFDEHTTISALTVDGLRPGYPISVDGWASVPSFGPGGRFHVTVDAYSEGAFVRDSSSQVIAFTRDGRIASGWPVQIPIDTTTGWPEGAGPPRPPVSAPNGSVYIAAGPPPGAGGAGGAIAYAFDPSGESLAGWPYESEHGLVAGVHGSCTCACPPCACPWFDSPPLAGSDGTLYIVQGTAARRTSGGNTIVAVSSGGDEKAGWPVTLAKAGAWFASIAVGDDGAAYGFAIEPAGARTNTCGEKVPVYSGTIVALDARGDSLWVSTIVAP
jgi:hypothetical protein